MDWDFLVDKWISVFFFFMNGTDHVQRTRCSRISLLGNVEWREHRTYLRGKPK
jgi:hypothetical protein